MLYANALEAISKLDTGAELLDAIKAEVNDKGKENKSLRDRLKAFGDKSADSVSSVFTALEAMDIDLTEDIPAQLAALEKKAGSKVTGDYEKQIKTLQKAVEGLQKTLTDEQAAKEKLTADNKRRTIESGLSNVFSQKVLNPTVALKYHIGAGDFDLDESGKIVYKNKAGQNVTLTEGNLEAYLKDYPEAAKNVQNPGANSSPKDKGGQGSAEVKLTLEQVKAMTPAEVAKNYPAVREVLAAQGAQK
jgi:hypothetical protein